MSSNWPEVRKIVNAALDQPPEQRRAYAEQACGNDAALREAVWSLLSDDSVPSGFLEPPIEGAAVHLAAGGADRAAAIEHMGRYRVTEIIDSGGIGTVYRAVPSDDENGPPVAVKVLKRGMTGEDMQRRFRQEQEVLARLTHRNIARFIDGGVTRGGLLYLVMEFIEGRPIDRFCDQQKLAVSDRLELFEDVCSAVQYSHRNLVVHRDLKPRNILVTNDGVPKLLDFGIAKLLEEGSSGPAPDPTVTANRMITPQYASPEQIRGAPISTATDVYSLGVVLYELLTGHRPYDLRGKARGEILELIGEADPTSPSTQVMQTEEVTYLDGTTTTLTPELVSVARGTDPQGLRRELTGDLDTIVLTAMHKDPDRRYASVERLAEDLRRYRTGLPILARPDTFNYRARKFIRRNKAATVAATVAFISLIAGTTGLAIGLKEAQTAQAQLAEEAETARLEAKKAEQVSKFVQDMLASANPYGDNPDVTVRALLDEASSTIASALDQESEIRASIHRVIGSMYVELGEVDKAADHLIAALSFWRDRGERNLQFALAAHEMGASCRQRGEYTEAEAHYREALAVRREHLGDAHEEVANSLDGLGVVLAELGNAEESVKIHREALLIRRRVFGSIHRDIAENLNNLGGALYHMGKYAEAESHFRESLDMRRSLHRPGHPEIAASASNLAQVCCSSGKRDEADLLFREALAIRREALGDVHPVTVISVNNLGFLLHQEGRLEEGARLYREALETYRTLFGDDHPNIAVVLSNLAGIARERGSYSEAETLYRQALALERKLRGEEHYEVAVTLNNLASLLRLKGDDSAAKTLCLEGLEMRRKVLPANHPGIANSLLTMSQILIESEGPSAAVPLLEECLAIQSQSLPRNHRRRALAENLLGGCLTQLARYDEAESHLLQSYPVLHDKRGTNHRETIAVLRNIVSLYDSWGKPEKAAEYRSLLEEATGGDDSEDEGGHASQRAGEDEADNSSADEEPE